MVTEYDLLRNIFDASDRFKTRIRAARINPSCILFTTSDEKDLGLGRCFLSPYGVVQIREDETLSPGAFVLSDDKGDVVMVIVGLKPEGARASGQAEGNVETSSRAAEADQGQD